MPRVHWPLLLLSLAAVADAQTADRPSHKPLDTGIGDLASPEEELARRLSGARTAKGKRDELLFDKDLQELAKSLMKDPEFLKSLKDSIPPEQLKALADRFRRGEDAADLAADPALQKLLREGLTSPKLGDKERDLLKKWGEKNPPNAPLQPDKPAPLDAKQPPPNVAPPPAPARPKQEMPAWMRDRVERWSEDAQKWSKTPAASGWRDFARRMAESKKGGDSLVSGAMGQARGLGGYLPKIGDYLPRNLSVPRLPSVRMPALASPAMPSGGGAGPFIQAALVLLVIAVIAVVLWRGAGWVQAVAAARRSAWRLGPWPVTIDGVRTREHLIRAFEYLSLLLLGRAAQTRHHRDLARGLGAQPDMRPVERQESAGRLAELYEQARYAPPADDLSEDQLEKARRELRRLAGGAA
ncbi:MAG: hypothetical protein ACRC33_28965 [Gemmataceae bacterium]